MQKIAFVPALASVVRPGTVNVAWMVEGQKRAEAQALAKFDAAWDAAHADFLAEGKADWPVPPVAEAPFALPFEASRKGKRRHGKGGARK